MVFLPFTWQRQKKKKKKADTLTQTNRRHLPPIRLSKCALFRITAKQRAKIIVHLDNKCSIVHGTYRKLMPYHQDPGFFLRNHITIKNIFIYFKKECFRNMKVHFPFLITLILLFFEIVFEIQFSFLHYYEIHPTILVLGRRQQNYCFLRYAFLSCNYKFKILLGIYDLVS